MSTIRTILAKNVKTRRKSAGLTQAELAEATDLAPRTIQDIEYQKSWPSSENIEKLAQILRCSESDLFNDADAPKIPIDLTLSDAISVLEAYLKAEPVRRAVAMSVLTDDTSYIDAFPDDEPLHVVEALSKSL